MIKVDYHLFDECFDYDEVAGKLFWKQRPLHHFETEGQWRNFNSKFPGKEAGYNKKDGQTHYRIVKICGDTIHAHRVLYCLYNRDENIIEIDHIDGNGLNNSKENLRKVTRKVNARNQKKYSSNKTGITGVCYCPSLKKYGSTSRDSNSKAAVKWFFDFFEACCYRKAWELKEKFTQDHGKR